MLLFFSKLFQKEVGWRYSRTAATYGENGKAIVLAKQKFAILDAVELVLSLCEKSTSWPKIAHATIGLGSRHRLNPQPTHVVSGNAIVKEDDGLEDIPCIRPWSMGRDVARGVLRSSPEPEERPIFCHRRGIEIVLPVSWSAAPKCVCVRRLAGAGQLSLAVWWILVSVVLYRYVPRLFVFHCFCLPAGASKLFLCRALLLLKPGNTCYPCLASEAKAPVCST